MSDARLIEIKARSKTGQIVTFHVAEVLELDGQPVRDIARTEVATSSRATRRTVGMGAGTTF